MDARTIQDIIDQETAITRERLATTEGPLSCGCMVCRSENPRARWELTTAEVNALPAEHWRWVAFLEGPVRGPGFSDHYKGESAAVVRGPGFSDHYKGESAAVASTF